MGEYIVLQRGAKSPRLRVSNQRDEDKNNRDAGIVCYTEELSQRDLWIQSSIPRIFRSKDRKVSML